MTLEEFMSGISEVPTELIKQSIKTHPEDWKEVTEFDFDDYGLHGIVPCYGTMFSFKKSDDINWFTEHEEVLSWCGFRTFKHKVWGYFFGVDGIGYDYIKAHWWPLWKFRIGEL